MAGLVSLDYADLDWEADGTPRSKQFNDVYFSRDGGLAESRYVYLQGNNIPERWSAHFRDHHRFQLFEAGFGTGLNFLLTCRAFLQAVTAPDRRLRYVAVECFPLRRDDLQKALAFFPELAPLAQELLAQYPPALRGWHSLQLAGHRIELVLLFDDIAKTLPALTETDWRFDAWYLDGFAPARNEAMWADALWPAVRQLSRTGATAATFSAAGAVRRGLQQAQFEVQKIAGFGRKRDMTVARFVGTGNGAPSSSTSSTPSGSATPQHVLILGAGIAGSASARVLAERGITVTVLDQHAQAGGTLRQHALALASPRWSRDHNPRSQFQLSGFLILQRLLRQLGNAGYTSLAPYNEVLTLLADDESAREQQVLQELGLLGEFADWLPAEQATKLAGVPIAHQAVLHRLAVAVDPGALCRVLLDHEQIRFAPSQTLSTFHATAAGCTVTTSDGKAIHADALFICGGADCRDLLAPFPLRPVRGQSSDLPATTLSRQLQRPLRFGGYLTPAQADRHLLGASYDGGVFDPQISEQSQRDNLATLAWAQPALAEHWREAALAGDVGHRLVTQDRAPLVGAHPQYANVWLNLAHGSHALMTACAGAELLAAQLLGDAPAFPATLQRAVAPARFQRYFTAN